MAKYTIKYDEDEGVQVCDDRGGASEVMDYPETGIGLVMVGDKPVVLVTPDYDGKLDHDTVYELVPATTDVQGDFVPGDEDGDDEDDDDDDDDVVEEEEDETVTV
jgi:hypothetical protein